MLRRYFTRLFTGIRSLLVGLGITLKNMGRKPVTLCYPHEKPVLSPVHRGSIQFVRFEETGSHDCVACKQCERICPSFCIDVDGGKVEGIKKKRAESFSMDFSLCSLCGLCIDVCPTDTLEFSKAYDVVGTDRHAFVHDLLAPYQDREAQFRIDQATREAEEDRIKAAAKAKKKAAAAAAKKKKAEAEANTQTTEEVGT